MLEMRGDDCDGAKDKDDDDDGDEEEAEEEAERALLDDGDDDDADADDDGDSCCWLMLISCKLTGSNLCLLLYQFNKIGQSPLAWHFKWACSPRATY